MKTKGENYYTWDDVIFENRNRSYGAYLVRQSYSRNATIAFGASVSFAILLIFLPQIISSLSGGKVIIPSIIACDLPTHPLPPPQIIKDSPPIAPPPTSTAPAIKNIPPQVVTTETDVVIPPNAKLLATEDPIGDGLINDVEITGPGTIEVPVIAPSSDPLVIAEVMPAYDGGQQAMIKFISKNIRYPKSASSVGVEGTVYVSFVINAEGDVVDVKVVRGVSADCDKEAMRVIAKMNEWSPGEMNHNPVSVRMVLPIKFQINH